MILTSSFKAKIIISFLFIFMSTTTAPTDIYERMAQAYQHYQEGNDDEALQIYQECAGQHQKLTTAHFNCGFLLKKLGHYAQAIPYYEHVLEEDPHYALAHLGISVSYLALGEFTRAWPHYEWRSTDVLEHIAHYDFCSMDIRGKRILIRSEFSLGDNIQFVRYAQKLHEMGARVIVQTFAQLKPLFALAPYIETVITHGDAFPPHDFLVALMSLPYDCGTTLTTIPAPTPYLYADTKLIEQWRARLATDTRFKVGICWHGSGNEATAKNIPLQLLMQLAHVPGISLYSLQKKQGLDQLSNLSPEQKKLINVFHDLDENSGPFMDTAALVENLDLVITVDTSVAHLAGALGKQVWVLLPYVADWRWLIDRADSPWYPTMRLIRQSKKDDWINPINKVTQELTSLIMRTKGVPSPDR